MTSRSRLPETVVAVAVGANVVTGASHGVVHATAPVPVPASLLVLVAGTVALAPLYGVWLLRRGETRRGGSVVAVSLAVAFAVETLAHFGVPNPDHVASVDHEQASFAATAASSVATDAIGAVAGTWYWFGASE